MILIASPWWTSWWQRNYFADLVPWLGALMATRAMRVSAVAVGVVAIAVGLSDLWLVLAGRAPARDSSDS